MRFSLLGFTLWGHPDSELLHQRHQVPVRPFFGDFGAFDPVDGGAGDGALPIGRRHAEEGALVSSSGCPVDHDLVAFGDGVVDRKLQVGKAPAAALDVVPYVVRSRGEGGEYGIVETALVCDKFGDDVQLSLVPALVYEPAYDLLVIGWLLVR